MKSENIQCNNSFSDSPVQSITVHEQKPHTPHTTPERRHSHRPSRVRPRSVPASSSGFTARNLTNNTHRRRHRKPPIAGPSRLHCTVNPHPTPPRHSSPTKPSVLALLASFQPCTAGWRARACTHAIYRATSARAGTCQITRQWRHHLPPHQSRVFSQSSQRARAGSLTPSRGASRRSGTCWPTR